MTTDTDRALPLLDSATARVEDAETIAAGIRELVQLVNAGLVSADARADLGGDLLAAAERLSAYAVAVIG